MIDIIERLREAAELSLNEYGEADRYREAADEIERLKEVVIRLQKEKRELKAEIAALTTGKRDD